jgi:hypothetical protein
MVIVDFAKIKIFPKVRTAINPPAERFIYWQIMRQAFFVP